MCTLHAMGKHGPRNHITGKECGFLMVPRKITRVKMKLQYSTVPTSLLPLASQYEHPDKDTFTIF